MVFIAMKYVSNILLLCYWYRWIEIPPNYPALSLQLKTRHPSELEEMWLITHELRLVINTLLVINTILVASSCIYTSAWGLSWGATWTQHRAHVLPIAGIWIPVYFKSRLLESNTHNPFLLFAKPYLPCKLVLRLIFFVGSSKLLKGRKKRQERRMEKNP